MDSFTEDKKPVCGEDSCLVFQECKDIKQLQEFGIKLGSLNETSETEDIIHRGPSKEIHKSSPMYFKIPVESYLIPGPLLGFEKELCYLSITGSVPDDVHSAVLGQPFLENYLTILDQENMKIGLGAHLGSDAGVSSQMFNDMKFSIWMLAASIFIMFGIFFYMCVKCLQEKYKTTVKKEEESDDLVRTNSKEL